MLDFIPIEYYKQIYFNTILLMILVVWVYTNSTSGFKSTNTKVNLFFTFSLLTFLIIYIGFRPISGLFVDMLSYARMYDKMIDGNMPPITYDFGFFYLIKALIFFHSKTVLFFILSLFYILPLYIAVKRWFPNYYFFAFLILVASFSFWAFGTNGLRNGISTSILILAFSFAKNKKIMYLLFAIAYSFHSSALIPITAYSITLLFQSSYVYFTVWFTSIFLSFSMGSFWEKLLINVGFVKDDRLLNYFGNKDEYANQFASSGFRWDFLIYSSLPVIIAYYFIFIKKFNDNLYKKLVYTYLLSNTVWILVIRASFSNRFAYLSWFMMGIIIIYPFLKQVYWKNQFSIIGMVIFLYYTFTYFMNIFIY